MLLSFTNLNMYTELLINFFPLMQTVRTAPARWAGTVLPNTWYTVDFADRGGGVSHRLPHPIPHPDSRTLRVAPARVPLRDFV